MTGQPNVCEAVHDVISSRENRPAGFDGSVLKGCRVVKFAYLDEAGIGGEGHTIVAGVLIDPDKQWLGLRDTLANIAARHLLKEDRDGVVFHAMDLWHGKKVFSRKRYSTEKRHDILQELCEIPKRHSLPIFGGIVENNSFFSRRAGKLKKHLNVEAYCLAYANCVCLINAYLNAECGSDELVTLVIENNDVARKHIKETQKLLKDATLVNRLGADHNMAPHLPIVRVVDVPHFVEKVDSPIMQIADAIAFILNRRLSGKTDITRFWQPIGDQLVLARPDGTLRVPVKQ